MRLFIVDAFAKRRFAGNQAGVALLPAGGDFPEPGFMQALAAELRHSETAFVKRLGPDRFRLRYFTPEGEVDLCGHATIAAFTVLREADGLPVGSCTALTRAGALAIQVEEEAVWMDMAPPRVLRALTGREAAAVYRAYGLPEECRPVALPVQVVSTGLADVLLPVDSGETLAAAIQDEAEVKRLSEELDVVGVHMFCRTPGTRAVALCRNFAPRYAIPEEAATGTSNGALTYYLYRLGLVEAGAENRFFQGESMGKPSEIRTRLLETPSGPKVLVGGQAVLSLRCELL